MKMITIYFISGQKNNKTDNYYINYEQAFYISKKWNNNIKQIKYINNRISMLSIILNKIIIQNNI